MAKAKIPEFVKSCPWEPFEVKKVNLTIGGKNLLDFVPIGVYRVRIIAKTKSDEDIFKFSVLFELF